MGDFIYERVVEIYDIEGLEVAKQEYTALLHKKWIRNKYKSYVDEKLLLKSEEVTSIMNENEEIEEVKLYEELAQIVDQ